MLRKVHIGGLSSEASSAFNQLVSNPLGTVSHTFHAWVVTLPGRSHEAAWHFFRLMIPIPFVWSDRSRLGNVEGVHSPLSLVRIITISTKYISL